MVTLQKQMCYTWITKNLSRLSCSYSVLFLYFARSWLVITFFVTFFLKLTRLHKPVVSWPFLSHLFYFSLHFWAMDSGGAVPSLFTIILKGSWSLAIQSACVDVDWLIKYVHILKYVLSLCWALPGLWFGHLFYLWLSWCEERLSGRESIKKWLRFS